MKFFVIGIDDNKDQHFSKEIMQVIQANSVFSGGKRHYEIVRRFLPHNADWIEIAIPLDLVFLRYEKYKKVVVFVSGDPLFFGFANTIQTKMPDAEIVLYPFFNSLQLLAHRLLMSYQDMHIVSLTGRSWQKFDEALILGYEKIGILTDNNKHTPAEIVRRMLYYGYDNYTITIGERLGNKEKENIITLNLHEVLNNTFAFPNNLILQKNVIRSRPLGISDNEFYLLDGRTKMITKRPVRLLTLSLLDLRNKTVFWDIGFCTGSVSIEAKLQFPHLCIMAFEQRIEGLDLITNNSRKFGTPGIIPIIGDFTEIDISGYSVPDAVFIGGHGGKLKEIVSKICTVLNKKGIIVFNSVSKESRQLFEEAIKQNNLLLESSTSLKVDDFSVIEVMKAKYNDE